MFHRTVPFQLTSADGSAETYTLIWYISYRVHYFSCFNLPAVAAHLEASLQLTLKLLWSLFLTRAAFTLIPLGFHPVFVREPSDAAGELHHPGSQADREPAAAAGERGQNPVLHGPRHQLLPRGQRHRQDHQRGVSTTFIYGCFVVTQTASCIIIFFLCLRPTGRLDEYLACIAKIQKAVEYFQDNNPDSPELNTVVKYLLLSEDTVVISSLHH